MFNKGDLIRVIGDEDNELFVVTNVNVTIIVSYNFLGHPQWGKDRTKMMVKSVTNLNYPGQIIIDKSRCENFMVKKQIKPYLFLN